MSSKNMHRLLLLLRRPIHLACLILPVLALGLILVAPGEQSLVRAGDPVIAPPGLVAEPDTPLVHPLDTADREAWEWEVIRKQTDTITITAEDALNSPQNVPLTLVVAQEIYSIRLPLVTRNYNSP